MTFIVFKISFVILLTNLNVKFTFCNPDPQSVDTTIQISEFHSDNPTQLVWYTYDINGEDSRPAEVYLTPVEPTATRVTRTPWAQFNPEHTRVNLVKQDQPIQVQPIQDDSSNHKPLALAIGGNTGSETRLNTYSGSTTTPEPKRISELKCEEFGQAVGKKVWALALVGVNQGVPVSSNQGRCEGQYTPLIVKGTKAQSGEFPHMAALGWKSNDQVRYLCGGSLISDRWVLTAAHCLHGSSGSPSVVRLGTHLLSDNTLGQVVPIKQMIKHQTYNPPAMYADIALLELDTPIVFSQLIRPTCLHQEYDAAPEQAWATGWGSMGYGEDTSDALLKAGLNILDTVSCARKYNRSTSVPRGIVPSMLCAGDVSGNWESDTCQGDSGGPLQIIHPTISCLYQQVGITSFGKFCALDGFPGVYTRVSHYLDWIEGIVWPEGSR